MEASKIMNQNELDDVVCQLDGMDLCEGLKTQALGWASRAVKALQADDLEDALTCAGSAHRLVEAICQIDPYRQYRVSDS